MMLNRRQMIAASTGALFGLAGCTPRPAVNAPQKAVPPLLGLAASIGYADIVADAGGDYIEESTQDFLLPDKPKHWFEANVEVARHAPIPIVACRNFLPGRIKTVGPDADLDAALSWAQIAFERAALLDIHVIVFGSGGSRRIPKGFPRERANAQFVECLKRLADTAHQHGVVLCLEPLRPQEVNYINRVSEAVAIAKSVDHPNIQVTADIFHMLHAKEDSTAILDTGRMIHHVHVAEKNGRRTPGVNNEDMTPYFRALQAVDYSGPITIEGKWKPEELALGFQTIQNHWGAAELHNI